MKKNNQDKECIKIDPQTGQEKKVRCKSLTIQGTKYRTLLNKKFESRKTWSHPNNKQIIAFIPGVINKLFIEPGQKINKNDNALILDAMKMNNLIKFRENGTVKAVNVTEGQCVMKGHVLVEMA